MDFTALTEASFAVQLHLFTALFALVTGILIWRTRKGTVRHRWMGRLFVGAMVITAISAFFIRSLSNGSFSIIHIFVPITLIGSVFIVSSIRRGDREAHQKHVRNMFYFALLIPGAFAMMPGRLLWRVFFG